MFALQKPQEASRGRKSGARSAARVPAHPLLALQRKCACGGGCPRCGQEQLAQAKLRTGEPDDALEREADLTAERVLRAPQPAANLHESEGGKPRLSRYAAAGSTRGSSAASPLVDQALRAPGRALDPETRDFMEARFGRDFSGVRVHSDASAERSTQELDALAYTVGRDIVFGAGQYEAGTTEGRRLIAHELAHVVQQGGTGETSASGATHTASPSSVMRPALQTKPKQKTKQAGWVNYYFTDKVKQLYLWPSAWGSMGWLQEIPVAMEVWKALIDAGAQVAILFVAERSDIPAGGADQAVQGYCDDLGGGAYNLYVLAGQVKYVSQQNPSGSTTIAPRIAARPSEDIAETVFHEMLHAWFQTTFPGSPIPTGHTAAALPVGDPKFDATEYDPEFLSRLYRFSNELAKLKQKQQATTVKAQGKP